MANTVGTEAQAQPTLGGYAIAFFNGFLACECALAMAIALAASDAAEANYQAKSAVLFALLAAVALAIAWLRIKR